MRTVVEEGQINGVPILELFNPDAVIKLPIIIVLHGFCGSKESNLAESYNLAKNGFYVVAMDAYRHGDLMDDAFVRLSRAERSGEYWNVVTRTTPMLASLIEYYQDHKQADGSRIGLIGRSMGGMVIYHYLTGNRQLNVKAAVIMVSTPSWVSFEHAYYRFNPAVKEFVNPAAGERMAEIEPVKRLQCLKNFPLLMMNGVDDPKIPINDVRNVFMKMHEGYDNKDAVQLVEYAGTGHQVTAEMIDRAANWFRKFLEQT